MNIDFEILKQVGTTNERLRQMCSAKRPDPVIWDQLDQAEKDRIDQDIKNRKALEDRIGAHLNEHIIFSLKNTSIYGAVDMAWDSKPINKETLPLILFAQDKLDLPSCVQSLKNLKCGDDYFVKNDKGKVTGIDLPKMLDVEVNLIRHMVTRRLAAQSAKYYALYPYYRYESRGTSPEDKLGADVWSQRADIMADQFDHRHHDMQCARDILLYGHVVDFVRSAWESERQWVRKPAPDGMEQSSLQYESAIVKEGIAFTNPHPTRVFSQMSHPVSEINADIGPEYLGYWDIATYGTAKNNPDYFNKDEIGFNTGFLGLFTTYSSYFSQYYDTVTVPNAQRMLTSQPSLENDRVNQIGRYSESDNDAAMLQAIYFMKMVPKDWGIGSYPYPVWVRFIWAGTTIVYSEFLPSKPAAYGGLNENDSRRVNISFAMELMPYQDQLSNLLTQLLSACKSEQMKILSVNKDVMEPTDQKKIEADVHGKNWFIRPLLLFYSASKMQNLGINTKEPVSIQHPTSNPQSITFLFQSITQLISLAERLTAMSPNEVGQPIARGNGGVTATEASQIQSTTTTMEAFISDAIDEFRAAKKRIILESYKSLGSPEIRVPVLNRYPPSVIKRAGFRMYQPESALVGIDQPERYEVIGDKYRLPAEFIFSTRDGSDREQNVQTATTLIQLIPLLTNELIAQQIPKEKFFEVLNEIFRKSGAAIDLNLEVAPGDDNRLVPPPEPPPDNTAPMEQMVGILEQHSQQIAQLQKLLYAFQSTNPTVNTQSMSPMIAGGPVPRMPTY